MCFGLIPVDLQIARLGVQYLRQPPHKFGLQGRRLHGHGQQRVHRCECRHLGRRQMQKQAEDAVQQHFNGAAEVWVERDMMWVSTSQATPYINARLFYLCRCVGMRSVKVMARPARRSAGTAPAPAAVGPVRSKYCSRASLAISTSAGCAPHSSLRNAWPAGV